ncbi:PH domain-containing protein [Allosphingosinicella indica]|uniref:PH domain-containing protein n=1 Tax=Allosphingosinicella indica TaxID=941907 RepID=A0A1X7GJ33_9SPHN|nr:PH domain-containing protein [Allosphingosinicella indica]SMF70513.1 PH domain-containing protein [Allosphingosinicella indica]
MGITALNFVDIADVERDAAQHLMPSEKVAFALKAVRDLNLFTDRRLVMIDQKGVTGRTTEVTTVPYSRITRFSVETIALVPEVKIWTASASEAIKMVVSADGRLRDLNLFLADKTCG